MATSDDPVRDLERDARLLREENQRLRKDLADSEKKLTQQQETTARWHKVVGELKAENKRLQTELAAERAVNTNKEKSLW